MRRVTVRLRDEVHQRLELELVEWRKVRGPKFSLNDLCSEKLSFDLPVTQWVTTETQSTNNVTVNPVYLLANNVPQLGVLPKGDPLCQKKKLKP